MRTPSEHSTQIFGGAVLEISTLYELIKDLKFHLKHQLYNSCKYCSTILTIPIDIDYQQLYHFVNEKGELVITSVSADK